MSYEVLILGAGESGTGAAALCKKNGLNAFVIDGGRIAEVYKEKLLSLEIEFKEEATSLPIDNTIKQVVKSPGIPNSHPWVMEVRKAGFPVLSEIAFASLFCTSRVTAVTGTNGKTTTASLVYHVYKKAGLDVRLAGNIGKSWAADLAELDTMPEHYVLEVSSFQLDDPGTFRANTAILTNLSPDHLDRYDDRKEAYYAAKYNMAANQTPDDYFIWNADDEESRVFLRQLNIPAKQLPFAWDFQPGLAAWVSETELNIDVDNQNFTMQLEALALKGRHNTFNAMAAGIAARVNEIRNEAVREAFSDFENIEHRLETVIRLNGVHYINDSKATNVNAAWYALECMDGPVIWIAGGVDKGNDYTALLDLVKDKVKVLICLGKDNGKLREVFGGLVPEILETTSMEEAVRASYVLGKSGDTVLLSPACASFDLFRNYEDRGYQFKSAVRSL
jgi:UDP-N-acetylmuramoylalanine--D-glutamate ligase